MRERAVWGFEMAFFSLLLRSQYAEPSFLQVIISILLRISLVSGPGFGVV